MNPLIIITGGSRGIGLAIVKKLISDGYNIHVIARKESPLEKLKKEFNVLENFNYSLVDISNPKEIDMFLSNWNCEIYGLINNAGHWKEELLEDEDNNCLSDILNLNLIGLYHITKGLLNHITNPGRIINISSQLGSTGRKGMGAYCASKHALLGLTKCWGLELVDKGILVNAVSPGWVMTQSNNDELHQKAARLQVEFQTLFDNISEELILKRFIEPNEVANLVSFLVSKDASGISGQDFIIK